MAKPTRGEWRVHIPRSEGAAARAVITGPTGLPHIAVIPKVLYAAPEAEALANASLIAAGPDLLDACRAALEFDWKSGDGMSLLYERLKAAIQKAEGGNAGD